jgi:hypothetical protein
VRNTALALNHYGQSEAACFPALLPLTGIEALELDAAVDSLYDWAQLCIRGGEAVIGCHQFGCSAFPLAILPS